MEITKGNNLGDITYFLDDIKDELRENRQKFLKKCKRVGTINKFKLYLKGNAKKDYELFLLNKNYKVVSYMSVTGIKYLFNFAKKNKKSSRVMHTHETTIAWVKKEYRGLGIGKKLYKKALSISGTICSSTNIGTMSLGVWKSLSKINTFKMYELDNSYYEKIKKPVKYNWNSGIIPLVQNKKITSLPSDFVFMVSCKT